MRRWLKVGVSTLAILGLLSGCTTVSGPETPPVMDRNGNKIFDDLDDRLRTAGADELIPVLVMMKDQAEVMRFTAADDFEVKHRYQVVPALAASMTKAQIIERAKDPGVRHIERDAEVQVQMGTASQWFGATKARQDFGVTGDRDGNPTGYSKQDVVVAVIDTGRSVGHRT